MKLTKSLLSLIVAASPFAASADPISPAKALELSRRFMPQDAQQTLEVCAKRSGKFDGSSPAKGSASQSTSPYYIISRGAGNGFVIVSGDDCLPEIIGVVDHGDYDENDMPESFRDWLQYRADQVEYAQAKGINTPFVSTAVVAGRQDVAPLIQTLWHQSSPYNDKCPRLTSNGNRAATGCVATAASQIAYYWRRDARTTTGFTTPTYTYGDAPALPEYQIPAGTPLKWDLMMPRYTSEPAEYKEAVATLVAMMGMSSNLTYGASTGGQISDMVEVFRRQIGINGGTCVYKTDGSSYINGFNEAKWSELLYNQLIKKRPLLYCGYNSGQGGHAVVCDGYQASTGYFHINFGWGDDYNGYFSVEDGVKGWGFNESWTGCVYDIYPTKPKTEVQMTMPERVFRGQNVRFNFTLTNKSTLPFKGVYFFLQNSSSTPTKLTSAKGSFMQEIPTDGSVEFDFSCEATSSSSNYVFLLDENFNVLYKTSFKTEIASSSLSFADLSIATSSDVEEMNGEEYNVLYNTTGSASAQIQNNSSQPYYGSVILDVFNYDATKGEWKNIGNVKGLKSFQSNALTKVDFSLGTTLGLKAGNYYYATISDSISSSKDKITGTDNAKNIVRFKVATRDMSVVSFTNNVLKVKGHFDQTFFNSTTCAKKSTYKTAVAYDLTDCKGVSTVWQEVNPNALYYVSDDSKAEGPNIIKCGHAKQLVLTTGYDFAPQASFTTDSTVIMNCTEKVGQWAMLTAPAKLNVPMGMAAREIDSHYTGTSGLLNKVSDVTTLEAGKTYIVMSSTLENNTLTGGASTVTTSPIENKDVTVVGNYTTTTTPEGGVMLAMGSDGVQYLEPVAVGTEVPALRGYMLDSKVTQPVKTYKVLVYDKYYLILADDIFKATKLIERYSANVAPEFIESLTASIKEAETVFSYRELDADYNNVKTTYENLEAKCVEFMTQLPSNVSVNTDVTSLIKNPSFESKTTYGWTVGSATYAKAVVGTNANMYRGVGIDGSYLLNNLNASDSTSVSLEQTVKGLTPGYYRLTAKVGTSVGRTVTMFADNETTTVSGHKFGRLYLVDAAIDDILVLADSNDSDNAEGDGAQTPTGSLRIGIKAGDWYKADNFQLTLVRTLNSGVNGDLNGDGKVTMQDVNIAINRPDRFTKQNVNDLLNIYLGK